MPTQNQIKKSQHTKLKARFDTWSTASNTAWCISRKSRQIYSHTCLLKKYNLIVARRRQNCLTGKVTDGPASLQSSNWLTRNKRWAWPNRSTRWSLHFLVTTFLHFDSNWESHYANADIRFENLFKECSLQYKHPKTIHLVLQNTKHRKTLFENS